MILYEKCAVRKRKSKMGRVGQMNIVMKGFGKDEGVSSIAIDPIDGSRGRPLSSLRHEELTKDRS